MFLNFYLIIGGKSLFNTPTIALHKTQHTFSNQYNIQSSLPSLVVEKTQQTNNSPCANTTDINTNPISDPNSKICLTLIENYLSSEIWHITSNSEKYGFSCISKKTLTLFLNKLEMSFKNILSKEDKLTKQMFYLHHICKGLYEYNEYVLNLPNDKFRASVLFPNLMYILIRYYTTAKGFLQSINRKIFNEHKSKNVGIINKFITSYYIDEEVIKSDVLYSFLGNCLRKYNPLTDIHNIYGFYIRSMRSIYFYYFKSDRNFNVVFMEMTDIERSINSSFNIPTRLINYRDVLYEIQIEKMCENSITMCQLGYNYGIFKNVILDNEFQNMYYSVHSGSFMVKNNQFKLMNLYEDENENNTYERQLLDELKKIPLVYKLLRCIHIVNPKHKPYLSTVITPEIVKITVLEELMHPFKHMFAESYIYNILESTASNFVTNIMTGEYINPITFTTVKICHYSFITQLRSFIQLCIKEIGMSK